MLSPFNLSGSSFQLLNSANQIYPKTEIYLPYILVYIETLEKIYIAGLYTCSCPLSAIAVYPQAMVDFDPQVSHPLDGYTSQMINPAQYFGLDIAPQWVDYSYDPDNPIAPCFTEASASDFNGHGVTQDEPEAEPVELIF